MEILYTPESRDDLLRVRDIIIERWDNPQLAEKVLKDITQTVRNLGTFPGMGAELRKRLDIQTDYRCLFCGQNYIFYRVGQDAVKIIRILNEKEDFMRILFGISETGDGADWE